MSIIRNKALQSVPYPVNSSNSVSVVRLKYDGPYDVIETGTESSAGYYGAAGMFWVEKNFSPWVLPFSKEGGFSPLDMILATLDASVSISSLSRSLTNLGQGDSETMSQAETCAWVLQGL